MQFKKKSGRKKAKAKREIEREIKIGALRNSLVIFPRSLFHAC